MKKEALAMQKKRQRERGSLKKNEEKKEGREKSKSGMQKFAYMCEKLEQAKRAGAGGQKEWCSQREAEGAGKCTMAEGGWRATTKKVARRKVRESNRNEVDPTSSFLQLFVVGRERAARPVEGPNDLT